MTGIILYGSFELAPYSKKYMDILESAGEKYDLIGWRREEIPQYTGENVYMYGAACGKSRYSSPIQTDKTRTRVQEICKEYNKEKGL